MNGDANGQPCADKQSDQRRAKLARVTIGEVDTLSEPVRLSAYDPEWPVMFVSVRKRIGAALGETALQIEHVGSTSVPGLAAKPKIDILLVVPDSGDEKAYVPQLEKRGFVLRIREPDWYEHRLLNGPDYPVNCHVFSKGCVEIERKLVFLDWLRMNTNDRIRYEQTKRELASKQWRFMQDYADAKSEVVEDIIARAIGERSTSDHR